jgi:hypothetical protein
MGSQLNYFVIPADMRLLETAFRSIEPMFVLTHYSPTADLHTVKNFAHVDSGKFELYFALVRPVDLSLVITRYVSAQNHWVIDTMRSPVVEVTGCFFDDNVLRRGRLYFNNSYYREDGELIIKSEAFCKWGRALISTARRQLVKRPDSFFYIGAEAQKWHDLGGVFEEI